MRRAEREGEKKRESGEVRMKCSHLLEPMECICTEGGRDGGREGCTALVVELTLAPGKERDALHSFTELTMYGNSTAVKLTEERWMRGQERGWDKGVRGGVL